MKVVPALFRCEHAADVAEGVEWIGGGVCADLAQVCFQLCEYEKVNAMRSTEPAIVLDQVQVATVVLLCFSGNPQTPNTDIATACVRASQNAARSWPLWNSAAF